MADKTKGPTPGNGGGTRITQPNDKGGTHRTDQHGTSKDQHTVRHSRDENPQRDGTTKIEGEHFVIKNNQTGEKTKITIPSQKPIK